MGAQALLSPGLHTGPVYVVNVIVESIDEPRNYNEKASENEEPHADGKHENEDAETRAGRVVRATVRFDHERTAPG